MEKIFYTNPLKYPSSEIAVKTVLNDYFHLENIEIAKTENGKPYIKNQHPKKTPFYFSVSHTKKLLFIAVSNENVGIDAELYDRAPRYQSVVKKFSKLEQKQIKTREDFLRCWTAKESTVKWLGGKLAQELSTLALLNGIIYKEHEPLPAQITFLSFENHLIAVCSENNFMNAQFISF